MNKKYKKIEVELSVNNNIENVWNNWTDEQHIMHWNFASEDWCCPRAINNLKIGGTFSYRMDAKDGSFGFDFSGKYTNIKPMEHIEYLLDDGRSVSVEFKIDNNSVLIKEIFEAEAENSIESQRDGWLAILNNFKKYSDMN